MDVLERVAGAGQDLLDRVDRVLAAGGASSVDPIWPLSRRVGALPGETLRFALALDADALHAASTELRERSREFAAGRGVLDAGIAGGAWEGSGAEAFGALWQALSAYVGDGTDVDQPSLAGRLLAMASYVDDVVEWVDHTRGDLAMTIADALRSAEAVTLRAADGLTARTADAVTPRATEGLTPRAAAGETLRTAGDGTLWAPDGEVSRAAAAVGVRVLATVSDSLQAGHDLHDRWSGKLSDLPFHPPAESGPSAAQSTTRVEL
jgi:hypothetical protein